MAKTHSTHEAPRSTTGLPAALANINSNVPRRCHPEETGRPGRLLRVRPLPGDRPADGPVLPGRTRQVDPGMGAFAGLHRLFALVLADARTDSRRKARDFRRCRLRDEPAGHRSLGTRSVPDRNGRFVVPERRTSPNPRGGRLYRLGHQLTAVRVPADALHPVGVRVLERRSPGSEDSLVAGRSGRQRAKRPAPPPSGRNRGDGSRLQRRLGAGVLPGGPGSVPRPARPGRHRPNIAGRDAPARPGTVDQLLLETVAARQRVYGRSPGADVGTRDFDPLHPQRGRAGAARDLADLQSRQPCRRHERAGHGCAPRSRLRARARGAVPRKAVRGNQRQRQAQQLGIEHRHRCEPVRARRVGAGKPTFRRFRGGAASRRQQTRGSSALRRLHSRQTTIGWAPRKLRRRSSPCMSGRSSNST